jgi:DNA-binding NarL/FixJ family response regulator
MIRILLVDDQDLFRQGLAALLELEEDLTIVAQASNGNDAIAQAAASQPDVILMDIRMPICDGVTATQTIHQQFPWMRILVLTTFDEDEYIWQSLQAGASGYLLKSTPSGQLATAIRTLHQGHSQLGPTIASKVFAQMHQPVVNSGDDADYRFSDRESEILALLGKGLNNREIAQQLYLTEGTVKNHISRILAEMGMRDRTQVALWAQKNLGL